MKVLSYREDYLNSQKTRSEYNTKCFDYNCGGFALRTFSWIYPERNINNLIEGYSEREDVILDWSEKELDKEDFYELILKRDIKELLSLIPNLELFRGNPETYEEKDGEELIAYRIFVKDDDAEDNDFHFKVLRDGKWVEKNGGNGIRFSREPWFDESWKTINFFYDSKTIYFINKI